MLKEPIYGRYNTTSINRRFSRPIRVIAVIIISAFFIQDIAWSYPDPSLQDRPNNTKLAPASFDRRHTLEDKVATSLVFMIEQNHGIPVEKLTLVGVEAVLNKTEEFLVENKVVIFRNGRGITIYVNPNLVLRYTDSNSPSWDLPGFTEKSQNNLGLLIRHVFTKEADQLELDLAPKPTKDPKAEKITAVKRPNASYQNALKKLSKAYDKYMNTLRIIRWMRSSDRKYYRARAANSISSIKLARDKADDEVVALLEKISAMDWRAYKISPDASNDERLECVSLNVREVYIRLQKMMGDDASLSLMTNLKGRLKETVVPLLADYLAKETASRDATSPKRLPGISEFAEPLVKHAEMMRTISKMKRVDENIIPEDESSDKRGAIPLKAREEIFIIGEKCAEMARQLMLLDRSDESKAVPDAGLQSQYNKIVSKLIPAEEFFAVAAEEVAQRLVRYQGIMSNNINLVLAQGEMTAEFLESLANEPDVDWSRVNILALSGRTGISQENASSFRNFIEKHLSDNLPEDENIRSTNIYEISDENIEEYKKSLQGNLRPHVVVLTLGAKGEIGYNEPGTPFESTVHDVKLTDKDGNNAIARTLGISEIASAFSIFLLARPEDKDITVEALFGAVTADVPASILQTENVAENVTVLLSDEPISSDSMDTPGTGGLIESLETAKIAVDKQVSEIDPTLQPAERMIKELQEEREKVRRIHAKWPRAVVFFGSARIPRDHPMYETARQFGRLVFKEGWAIRSGSGLSMMEAPLRGYVEAREEFGVERTDTNMTQGVKIMLPHPLNKWVEDNHTFNYFVMRKLALYDNSIGVVIFPGGFGTMDELFEAMCWNKPIVFVGKEYWQPIIDVLFERWSKSVPPDYAGKKPLVVDNIDEAVAYLKKHSEENIGSLTDRAVMEMNSEIKDGIKELLKWPPGVAILGDPAKNLKELEVLKKVSLQLVSRKIPIRIGTRAETLNSAIKAVIGANKENSLQTVINSNEGPPQVKDNNISNYLVINDPSNYRVLLNENSTGFIFLPGGKRTLSRLFDIMALMQTKKSPRRPIILLGKDFWQPIKDIIVKSALNYTDAGLILPGDADLMQIADTPEEVMSMLLPGPSGGIDLPEIWTKDALEIARDADEKGRIIIAIDGYNVDQNRFTIGADYAFNRMVLKPLKNNWSNGFKVYYEDKFIGTCYPGSGEFNPTEIRRPTDYKGRFSITISGYKTNRFNLGPEYGSRDITLVPYHNDDWTTGLMVIVDGEAIAAYNAAENIFGLFKETRALDEKGRFSIDRMRYTLGTDNTSKYSGEKIILRPYKGFDWESGFTVYCNDSRIAYYDKETNVMAGMYVTEKSSSEDSERLAALHDLFTIESKDRDIKDGTRILLSESLFTNDADESELVQAQSALGSVLKSGYITIMKPEEIERVARRNDSKNKLAIVLTQKDFDNNSEIWEGSDKKTAIKSSMLILDGKFTGNNYLYLEGVIGLAQAMMANNRQAIRAYYELISGAVIGDEIMALLDDDSQNNISFAIKAVLRFRPITRVNSEDFNKIRINMENALIAA